MHSILERLNNGEVLLSDGAMGTMLQAHGLRAGECPESWCILHPEVVRGIAAAYVAAGSDIVETNSFGGTRFKLKEYGLQERVAEFNRAAARLAKEGANGKAYVAASIGPTGQILEEEGGDASEDQVYEAFREQATALAEGGADALCIETMSSALEASLAVRAAKDHLSLPVFCTFTFELGQRGFRTMMGLDPVRAAQAALEAGADVVGANCGNGIAQMIPIVAQIRAALPNVLILVHANAGMPVLENGKSVFKETPAEMAARVRELVDAGANIVGGCCGTTPDHIAAMARALRGENPPAKN